MSDGNGMLRVAVRVWCDSPRTFGSSRRAVGYGCLLRGTVTFRGCRCASPARAAQDDLERKAAARQKTREGSKQAAVREKYGLNKRA